MLGVVNASTKFKAWKLIVMSKGPTILPRGLKKIQTSWNAPVHDMPRQTYSLTYGVPFSSAVLHGAAKSSAESKLQWTPTDGSTLWVGMRMPSLSGDKPVDFTM